MAFLPSLGFLGFEIHIFYCNTPCLVWLPIQHRRKPISREPDFSVQKQGFLDGFLEERLKEYPELKAKIETMLSIIENSGGDVEKAAEAERRIIEEMRQMGNEVLHGWARRQQQKKEEEYTAKAGVNRKEKKRFTGTPESGKSKL